MTHPRFYFQRIANPLELGHLRWSLGAVGVQIFPSVGLFVIGR